MCLVFVFTEKEPQSSFFSSSQGKIKQTYFFPLNFRMRFLKYYYIIWYKRKVLNRFNKLVIENKENFRMLVCGTGKSSYK